MHSLKNTVVAVGLLGLSFLFYQASSGNPEEMTDLIPALDISEGLDEIQGLAASGLNTMQSKLDAMPDFSAPDLSQPKQIASDMANELGGSIAEHAAQFESQTGDFVDNAFPFADPSSRSANPSTSEFPAVPPKPRALDTLKSTPPPLMKSRPTTPIAPRKQSENLDRVSRDEGLIEALESQNRTPAGPAQTNNDFASNPATESTDDFQFASHTGADADSSYNQLATDRSGKTNSDVVQAGSIPDPGDLNFQSVWSHVDRLVAEEKFRNALQLLSGFYHSPDLTGPQRQRLIGWLDALAGKVIFSDENHLRDMPYTVMNESLADIGKRWKVPAQLIYNINRNNLSDSAEVKPGTTLKIVPGPFNAEIDLNQNIMTLFLGDLYAGRYPVRVGISGNPKPGTFRVLVKSAAGHNWRDADGKDYPPESRENGYGPNWIGLSGSLCIHAVDDSVRDGHRGCIGLSAKDAKDVFNILADGSTIKIIR